MEWKMCLVFFHDDDDDDEGRTGRYETHGMGGGLIATFEISLFNVNKISKFWVIDLYEIYMKK